MRFLEPMKVTAKSDKFLWLGNSLVLNLVNTQVLHEGQIEDLLQTPRDLLQWLADSGLAKDGTTRRAKDLDRKELEKALASVRDYRSQIRNSLRAVGFKKPISAALLRVTNDLLAFPSTISRLENHNRGRTTLTFEWRFASSDDVLRPIADSLAQLLATGEMRRIRRCKNPNCILYFYDVSRSNTRAWCSLDICGNKMRAAAFRERHSKN